MSDYSFDDEFEAQNKGKMEYLGEKMKEPAKFAEDVGTCPTLIREFAEEISKKYFADEDCPEPVIVYKQSTRLEEVVTKYAIRFADGTFGRYNGEWNKVANLDAATLWSPESVATAYRPSETTVVPVKVTYQVE